MIEGAYHCELRWRVEGKGVNERKLGEKIRAGRRGFAEFQ
jgi:hypothetical protein